MVNVPGAPGFVDLAFCNGMLLMTHPGASAAGCLRSGQTARDRAGDRIAIAARHCRRRAGGRVYVADHDSKSIAVISTDGWKVVDSIGIPGNPDALLLDGAGKLFWTDADAGTISLLDLHTKQDVAQTDVGGTPRDLAYDSARKIRLHDSAGRTPGHRRRCRTRRSSIDSR